MTEEETTEWITIEVPKTLAKRFRKNPQEYTEWIQETMENTGK